jgi:hypothetical protein
MNVHGFLLSVRGFRGTGHSRFARVAVVTAGRSGRANIPRSSAAHLSTDEVRAMLKNRTNWKSTTS